MKNMMLAVMLAASPAVAQEFAAEMPAVAEILVKTRALKTPPAAPGAPDVQPLRAKLLNDAETIKGKIRQYGDDPTRVGIYQAELSLVYMKLANTHASGSGFAASPAQESVEGTQLASSGGKRAEIIAEIETLREKFQKYENDPARSGIYALEISRLYMRLANL